MGDSRRLRLRAAQQETSMKLFQCQNCGLPFYLANTLCERCGLSLGHLAEQETSSPRGRIRLFQLRPVARLRA
jgi:hypothetical protein